MFYKQILIEDLFFISENEDIFSELFQLNENFLTDMKDKIFKKQKELKDAANKRDIKKIHNVASTIVPNDKKSIKHAKEIFKRVGGDKVKKAEKISKDLHKKGLNKSLADTVGMTASLTGKKPNASESDFKEAPSTIRWLTGWVIYIAGAIALTIYSMPLSTYIILLVALIVITDYISYARL